MSFEIEKGVPIPPSQQGLGRQRYPFNRMAVGDSFTVPSDDSNRVRSAASAYAKQHRIGLTCRRESDGRVRVWRVS